jgi:hypothetical protein
LNGKTSLLGTILLLTILGGPAAAWTQGGGRLPLEDQAVKAILSLRRVEAGWETPASEDGPDLDGLGELPGYLAPVVRSVFSRCEVRVTALRLRETGAELEVQALLDLGHLTGFNVRQLPLLFRLLGARDAAGWRPVSVDLLDVDTEPCPGLVAHLSRSAIPGTLLHGWGRCEELAKELLRDPPDGIPIPVRAVAQRFPLAQPDLLLKVLLEDPDPDRALVAAATLVAGGNPLTGLRVLEQSLAATKELSPATLFPRAVVIAELGGAELLPRIRTLLDSGRTDQRALALFILPLLTYHQVGELERLLEWLSTPSLTAVDAHLEARCAHWRRWIEGWGADSRAEWYQAALAEEIARLRESMFAPEEFAQRRHILGLLAPPSSAHDPRFRESRRLDPIVAAWDRWYARHGGEASGPEGGPFLFLAREAARRLPRSWPPVTAMTVGRRLDQGVTVPGRR